MFLTYGTEKILTSKRLTEANYKKTLFGSYFENTRTEFESKLIS